jgi:tyrosyl-tRNA synthetase
VHGEEALRGAVKASEAMFGGSVAGIDARTLDDIFADVPSAELARDRLAGGMPVVDFLVESGFSSGKGAARRLIEGGGVYLNNVRVESAERSVTADDLVAGSAIVLRQGKKNYRIVRFKG